MEIAGECARAGGDYALSKFRVSQRIDSKGHRNVVTETDIEAELRIKRVLAEEFPDHAMLSEETAPDTDASKGWAWVVDPIDGTKNYAIGVPFWCTNIALCHDGDPVLALTYDALHGESFGALAGEGAGCNDASIAVSNAPDVFSSVLGIDLGYDDELGARQLVLLQRIFPAAQGFRITGSAALGLAYVACGRFDLYAHLNVAPWDIAAGILLVREAGGVISDRSGGPARITSRAFVAGGRRAHDDFLARYEAATGGA